MDSLLSSKYLVYDCTNVFSSG